MPWIKRKLRGNPVFVKVDEQGRPATDDNGRVDILYKASPDAKVYRAAVGNLEPTGKSADESPRELGAVGTTPAPASRPAKRAGRPAARAPARAVPADAIIIYTDGACTGNPGPMGIGAVIVDGDLRREISEYLGEGTNNIAELTAIQRSLEVISATDRDRTVLLHSDSNYAIGLLEKGWKAKANIELVARIRKLVQSFSDLRFVKVKGHAGIPENERCDELGRDAIARRA